MKRGSPDIRGTGEAEIDTANALLLRFFAEEGFSGTPETIAVNTRRLWDDPHHWIALAWRDGTAKIHSRIEPGGHPGRCHQGDSP